MPGSALVENEAGWIQTSGGHVSVLTFDTTRLEQGYEAWSGETCLGLLRQVKVEPVGPSRINRIQNGSFNDSGIFWTLDDKSGTAKIARNIAEEWTLLVVGPDMLNWLGQGQLQRQFTPTRWLASCFQQSKVRTTCLEDASGCTALLARS